MKYTEFLSRLLNVFLRGIALISRFILIFSLARFFEPSEVGLYGLFIATVSYGTLIVGAEYYTYSTRELLSKQREKWSFVLVNQLTATGILYIIFLPLMFVIFILKLLPLNLLLWFYILLVFEHIAQEINRLLVAIGRPLSASIVLFLRMGFWVWIIIPLMVIFPNLISLNIVFLAWSIGCFIAVILGIIIIKIEVKIWEKPQIDWIWIKKGFLVGIIFFISSLSFRALYTMDRYVVKYLAGPDLLGVYVFYIGISTAIVNFLEPAVFAFMYPRVVNSYLNGKIREYHSSMREMLISTVLVSIVLAIGALILSPIVITLIGKPIYGDYLIVLWILLIGAVIQCIGMVPHFGLYALSADRDIMLTHLISLCIFGITIYIVSFCAPFLSVATGLLVSFIWIGLYKTWRYLKLIDI